MTVQATKYCKLMITTTWWHTRPLLVPFQDSGKQEAVLSISVLHTVDKGLRGWNALQIKLLSILLCTCLRFSSANIIFAAQRNLRRDPWLRSYVPYEIHNRIKHVSLPTFQTIHPLHCHLTLVWHQKDDFISRKLQTVSYSVVQVFLYKSSLCFRQTEQLSIE